MALDIVRYLDGTRCAISLQWRTVNKAKYITGMIALKSDDGHEVLLSYDDFLWLVGHVRRRVEALGGEWPNISVLPSENEQ